MRLGRQFGGEVGPHAHRALVRTVNLVQREQVDVGADCRHVRQAVRAKPDAVYDGPCAGPVHEFDQLPGRVDAADDVRAVRERDDARPLPEQRLEVRGVQLAGRVDLPGSHDDAIVLQPAPRADVRFVVLVGDDHLVARPAGGGETPGRARTCSATSKARCAVPRARRSATRPADLLRRPSGRLRGLRARTRNTAAPWSAGSSGRARRSSAGTRTIRRHSRNARNRRGSVRRRLETANGRNRDRVATCASRSGAAALPTIR